MNQSQVELAADNNARWCDLVCQTHGHPGQFTPDLWYNPGPVPRYYPNAVTLTGNINADRQISQIEPLAGLGLPAGWAVKDSFAALDLQPAGFRELFSADWLWRSPDRPKPAGEINQVTWKAVKTAAELAAWEAAWRGQPDAGGAPRVFLPALLDRPDVVFIAAWQAGMISAGVIANQTGPVVGLSNLFCPTEQSAEYWAACTAAVMDCFPGHPLVGYERGDDLRLAQSAGFQPIGPLRVWAHRD